jgi:hypothetical protein
VSTRSPEELERALRALGLRVSIEAMDALAIAVPEPGERGFELADTRARAIALARAHGFSHLAVELRERERKATPRATLSRD